MPKRKTKTSVWGSKTTAVVRMLTRKRGCTFAEALKATGWPTVSLPAITKRLGLKLRRVKKPGALTRFYAA